MGERSGSFGFDPEACVEQVEPKKLYDEKMLKKCDHFWVPHTSNINKHHRPLGSLAQSLATYETVTTTEVICIYCKEKRKV